MSSEAMEENIVGTEQPMMAEHPWYTDSKYERYWNHYKQMKAWMQDQQSITGAWMHSYQRFVHQYHWWMYQNSSRQACHHQVYHPYHLNQGVGRGYHPSKTRRQHMHQHHHSDTFHHHHHHQPYRPHPGAMSYRANQQYTTDQSDVDYLDNGLSETLPEDDDDYGGGGGEEEFEIELSEEMRQFFLQSQKHREELKEMRLALDKKKSEEMTKSGDDVKEDAREQGSYDDEFEMSFSKSKKSKKKHIIGAPVEQPGRRRAEEMKVLYGSDSPAIHGMETAIQMQFDRNCDKKQPTFWPTVALKM